MNFLWYWSPHCTARIVCELAVAAVAEDFVVVCAVVVAAAVVVGGVAVVAAPGVAVDMSVATTAVRRMLVSLKLTPPGSCTKLLLLMLSV